AHRHHHHITPASTPLTAQPPAPIVPSMDAADGFVRPVRDVDRLGSILPFSRSTMISQPASPTTPLPPPQLRSPTVRPTSMLAGAARSRRRPSIRHQHSTAAEPEDMNADSITSDDSPDA